MTTDVSTPIFLDTNVLIQLHIPSAEKHEDVTRAVKRLLEENHKIRISRQVLREYAAVLTRNQPYAPAASGTDVAKQLRQFEVQYRVADEDSQTSSRLCALIEHIPVGGKQIHDANIVATMQANNIQRLFTLNVIDFERFSGLITIVTLDQAHQKLMPLESRCPFTRSGINIAG